MLRRLTLAAVATAVALLVGAPTALAHVELESSDPAEGAELSAAPTRVRLAFSGAVKANPESVKVTGPDGSAWLVSDVEVSGSAVTASVTPAGPAGQHGLTYRVTGTDGHVVTGTIRFRLSPAAVAATTTAQATTPVVTTTAATTAAAAATTADAAPAAGDGESEDGGLPAWLWVLFPAALVLGALWLFRKRK